MGFTALLPSFGFRLFIVWREHYANFISALEETVIRQWFLSAILSLLELCVFFFEGLGFQAFFLFVWSVLCDLWFISYFDWLWASFFMVRFWFSCSGTRYNFRFWPQYAICFWLICNFCMGFGCIGYRLEGRRSQQEDQTHCTKEWECVPEASCEGTFKIFKIKSFTRLPNFRRW